jgi:bifunctional UDP-N-acetylglucosamine pyrophosphorylase/glucosamine-1-phosphate N-acetyltransferase
MRPLTANTPKPLLPVAGKPFLQHTLEALREAGVAEVTILTGWRGMRIREFFGDGESLGITLTYEEQERRLGTAHAISLAKQRMDAPFLSVNGDVVLSREAAAGVLETWERSKETVMSLASSADPATFGVVEVVDGRVTAIEEKPRWPKSNLVNAGIYVFDEGIFDYIERTPRSSRGEYEITDTLQLLMADRPVMAYALGDGWIDVGRPWDMLKANELLMREMEGDVRGDVEEGATLKGPVTVDEGAVVRAGSYITGPVIIGERSEVGPNAYVRPSTAIGRGCRVGAACEVKNSILMDGAHVPHHNYVGDSVLGERVNLGSGTKIANLRLDEGNVKVRLKGQTVDTGLRKLGAIVGDDVKTGVNAVLDVGTIIGEGSFVGPGAVARGHIAPGSRVH